MINTKTIKQLNTFSPIKEDFLIAQSSSTEQTGKVPVENLFNIPLNNNNSILDNISSLQRGISTNNDNIITIQNSINNIQDNISNNSRNINNIQNTIIPAIQNDINELEQAIEQSGGSSSNLNNLLDGNDSGAIRSIHSATPDENYTMGEDAIALGYGTKAQSYAAYAQGYETIAMGAGSHAEGYQTQAKNNFTHAEGSVTISSYDNAHAEGLNTTASGNASHAEGIGTAASERGSHAEGIGTTASGQGSHASGSYTTASSANQTVIGRYNIEMQNNMYPFIIGNGTSNSRSNALAVDWTGNVQLGFDRNAAIGTTDGDLINALAGANFISTTDTMVNVKKLFTQLTNKQNTYEYELSTFQTFQRKDANYDFSNVVNVTAYGVTENVKNISLYAYGYNKNGNTWLQIWTTPIQFLGGTTTSRGSWVEFSAQVPEKFIPRSQYFTILYGIEPNASNSIYGDIFNLNSNMLSNYVANFALLKIAPIEEEEIDEQTQQTVTKTKWKIFISPMNLNKKDSSSSNQLIYICNCNYTSAYSPV